MCKKCWTRAVAQRRDAAVAAAAHCVPAALHQPTASDTHTTSRHSSAHRPTCGTPAPPSRGVQPHIAYKYSPKMRPSGPHWAWVCLQACTCVLNTPGRHPTTLLSANKQTNITGRIKPKPSGPGPTEPCRAVKSRTAVRRKYKAATQHLPSCQFQ